MIYFRNACSLATLAILFATFMLQPSNNDAKIAYKKPIYGKLYHHVKGHSGGYFAKKHFPKPYRKPCSSTTTTTTSTTTTSTTAKPHVTTHSSEESLDYSLQMPSHISEKIIKKHDFSDFAAGEDEENDEHLVKIIDEDDMKHNENQLRDIFDEKEKTHQAAKMAVLDKPIVQTTQATARTHTAPKNCSSTTSSTSSTSTTTTSTASPTTLSTSSTSTTKAPVTLPTVPQVVPCTCGVFLSSQIAGNSVPLEEPVITTEMDHAFQCNPMGQKQCQTKCLEAIVQHLPHSASILCATLNRDCRKERAYLFIKNCRNDWINTTLTAGREYCCKNGEPYACPRS